MPSVNLLEAVAVTAELCGRVFSEAAAQVFVHDLSAYPEEAVIRALSRCRKEVKGVLTVQDVVSRLDDGRPGPEEAWAMLPRSESDSAVWTDEMSSAWGVSRHLESTDRVAARFAFKEAYIKRVNEARDAGKRVNWTPTLGEDRYGRERVLAEAVATGKLPLEYAQQFVPQLEAPAQSVVELLEGVIPRLASAPKERA